MKLKFEYKIPTVNHYWGQSGHRKYITHDGNLFKALIQPIAIKEVSVDSMKNPLNTLIASNKELLSNVTKDNKKSVENRIIKEWKKTHEIMFSRLNPTLDNIECKIEVEFKRKGRDIDNFLKPLFDALEGILYQNDKQIFKLEITKCENTKKDYLVMYIDKI